MTPLLPKTKIRYMMPNKTMKLLQSKKLNPNRKKNKYRLNLWLPQLWMTSLQSLKLKKDNKRNNRNNKKIKTSNMLSFLQMMTKMNKLLLKPTMGRQRVNHQQRTRNKNKLNKIIKLRIEFKFERLRPKRLINVANWMPQKASTFLAIVR